MDESRLQGRNAGLLIAAFGKFLEKTKLGDEPSFVSIFVVRKKNLVPKGHVTIAPQLITGEIETLERQPRLDWKTEWEKIVAYFQQRFAQFPEAEIEADLTGALSEVRKASKIPAPVNPIPEQSF